MTTVATQHLKASAEDRLRNGRRTNGLSEKTISVFLSCIATVLKKPGGWGGAAAAWEHRHHRAGPRAAAHERERFTVLVSPHADKDARDQYEGGK